MFKHWFDFTTPFVISLKMHAYVLKILASWVCLKIKNLYIPSIMFRIRAYFYISEQWNISRANVDRNANLVHLRCMRTPIHYIVIDHIAHSLKFIESFECVSSLSKQNHHEVLLNTGFAPWWHGVQGTGAWTGSTPPPKYYTSVPSVFSTYVIF